jgi:Family of unknown function (DUF5906)
MTDTHSRDKANGAYFQLLHGVDLRHTQQRLLSSLLRQPGLVPAVLATGIDQEYFPEEWWHAFNVATKEPGRAKQLVSDQNGDLTIKTLYMKVVLLGHGQARLMAEQIVFSVRRRDDARHHDDEDFDEIFVSNGDATEIDAVFEHEQRDVGDAGNVSDESGKSSPKDGATGWPNQNSGLGNGEPNNKNNGATGSKQQRDADKASGEGASTDVQVDADLTEMNQKFAVVSISGKTRVVSFEESPVYLGCRLPVFSTIYDFCAFYAKRKKKVVGRNGKDRTIGIGKFWIEHEQRRQFSEIVYAPGLAAKLANGKLNLWNGYGCDPKKGNCDLYLTHLRKNICSCDAVYESYLLNWMAYAIQRPDRQGEVAVVMRGKEGTGKGVLAKQFGQLLGAHYRHIVQAKHLTGHFNAHLQHCSVLFADEAFFAGDRSHESILKALITEETLLIEPKGLDAFPVRNCVHLMMSSNNDWVVPAGADARRYFVLNVSDDHIQDHEYFAAITNEMDDGGREALLYLLLNRDLKDFNVRLAPQTKALAEQKAHSRRGVDRLVEIICHNGTLPCVQISHLEVAVTSGEEKGEGFYHAARVLVPELKHDSSIVLAGKLKAEWECVPWKAGNQRGIRFPALSRLREMFDEKHGNQDWPTAAGEVVNWA